jgi:hypothetical protein
MSCPANMLGHLRAIPECALGFMWSAGACSRRPPTGLARACSSHQPGSANLPIGVFDSAFRSIYTLSLSKNERII